MSADAAKHLERAKKYLEKNKLQEAAEEYQAVLKDFPNNQEAVQALGDLYTRLGDPVRAAQYYGMLFDRLTDSGDATRAAALYSRFLKSVQQSPDRMIRLDMSEFQTPESTNKILGSSEAAQPTDSLIMLVRKQPFSASQSSMATQTVSASTGSRFQYAPSWCHRTAFPSCGGLQI